MRVLLLASCLMALAGPALAEPVHFHTVLNGQNEVPPTGSSGTGTVDATLDANTGKFDYKVEWSGLTGPATMAHFHGPAIAGKNAGVLVPLGNNPTSPITGSTVLTPPQVAGLTKGKWYANVHTEKNPKGEIRGQLDTPK